MSATGGMHRTRGTAVLLAVAAAGLSGCEYADDVGALPAVSSTPSRSYAARAPLPTRDPQIVAAETRNLLELGAVLDGSPEDFLFGGSGGIGGTSSAGFSTSGPVRQAGQYKVTAACVGVPDAHLSVTQGAREGGTLLELSVECGSAVEAVVDLVPGSVSAHLIHYGSGVSGPGTGAVAGIRISFGGPGQ
ncbi:hypothetical protein NicSoilB4_30340 [Arthrobacter sp. NicSoilB4]|uniref:hypothetical protein n=1 Tax=Arthrobacter sp. NicSoilB4 TaxID=2830997 RepID=UPI001CC535F8|nr:hypothetical protein [Arthrobacter sp. NicSoilB4]BCW68271.1 hypothetical protein NicSoilB4_30340 [Arthrobacter sp. NicSoilB4]